MRDGIQKCKIAIENAIGAHSKQFDPDLVESVIQEMEKEKLPQAERTLTESAKLREACKTLQVRNMERMKREKIRQKLDKILLGKVGEDCSFFRALAGVDQEADGRDISKYQVRLFVLLMAIMEIF